MKTDGILDEPLIERTKSVNYLLLALIPLLMGPVIGIATNYLNVEISKDYFRVVMDWGVSDGYVTFLAMVQGVREGFLYGAVFSLIFTIYVFKTNRGGLGSQHFRLIFIRVPIIVLVCWLIGGLLGVLVFRYFPELTVAPFPDLIYRLTYELERYGWVAGSIWGGMIGGVLALGWAIWRTSRAGAERTAP